MAGWAEVSISHAKYRRSNRPRSSTSDGGCRRILVNESWNSHSTKCMLGFAPAFQAVGASASGVFLLGRMFNLSGGSGSKGALGSVATRMKSDGYAIICCTFKLSVFP